MTSRDLIAARTSFGLCVCGVENGRSSLFSLFQVNLGALLEILFHPWNAPRDFPATIALYWAGVIKFDLFLTLGTSYNCLTVTTYKLIHAKR